MTSLTGAQVTSSARSGLLMAVLLATVSVATAPAAAQIASASEPALLGPDLLPRNEKDRSALVEATAFQATLYGLSAYLQYEQLYRQAIDRTSPDFTGFSRFDHDRELAGPGYVAFKVPNSDTLYSNAWIDLTGGPVEVSIPATKLRYFTLNIFDMFGNPSNLSTRTIGSGGGRFFLVPPSWKGEAPAGTTLFRATTPHLWVLMRVFAQAGSELAAARAFQDAVTIRPGAQTSSRAERLEAPPPAAGATGFFRVLDYLLRTDGHLPGEEALVQQFRVLGLLADKPFGTDKPDELTLAAMARGYDRAMQLVESSKTQLGAPTGTGWSRVDKGKYGFNYVRRAVINAVGLGANVPEENASFTTFVDASGARLDGSTGSYTLRLRTPPPVDAFWSVTLYDGKTFELYPNKLNRYLVNDRTPGLVVGRDGSVEIRIQHAPARTGNWLPAPSGPFFVVIRSYMPKPAALDGRWLPPPIERADAQVRNPASDRPTR